MLTHLKLDNFKIWRTTGAMRLASLTLLLGANSSGKSSLIQSLLLIRQTVRGDDPNLDLNLGNSDAHDSVTLGQFRDLLCRHGAAGESNPANQVGVEFRWSEYSDVVDSTMFSARYCKGPSGGADLAYLRLGRDGEGFTVSRRKPGIYRLELAHESKPVGQSADYRPRRSFAFSPAAITALGVRGQSIESIGPALLDELSKIIYLGPVRRLAQRDYIWSGRMPAHIGDDGAKAVDALIASGVAIKYAKKRNQPEPKEATLFNQTIVWLKAMSLADDLSVSALGNSARYELRIHNNGESSNLKDVGVGVSQVLPVIVAALFAQPGHIVLIEEPESHLHPSAEAILADLFVQVAHKGNVQFIVETHSEHLLMRLQRRVAEDEIKAKDVAIYFSRRTNNTAVIEPLRLTHGGDIENWPENFFGDEMAELTARAIAALGKEPPNLKEADDAARSD